MMNLVFSHLYVHRQKERTRGVEVLGRNIAPLHFKTERVAETAFAHGDFEQLSLEMQEFGKYFSTPKDSKLTPDCLRCQ